MVTTDPLLLAWANGDLSRRPRPRKPSRHERKAKARAKARRKAARTSRRRNR